MPCRQCPAAFSVDGAAPGERLVVCRVESTARGERDAKAGPVALVRERTSPAALHGYCLGDLPAYVGDIAALGAMATEYQQRIADAARVTASNPHYSECPSWQAEKVNRLATKLTDQPGEQRVHALPNAT